MTIAHFDLLTSDVTCELYGRDGPAPVAQELLVDLAALDQRDCRGHPVVRGTGAARLGNGA
jgi:hypothetical protein